MTNKNFTIVDVETTGSSAAFGRIIEIGILRVERGELAAQYKSLINPGEPIPSFIAELTGISNRQLKKAPCFEDIAEEILPLFEDSTFVAHNSSFDYKFLKIEFQRAGLAFAMESLCTVRLSRTLFPEYKKHNLSAIIERFNFQCKHRHRAFDDAWVLWDFLQLLQEKIPAAQLETVLFRTIKKIPPKLQRKMPQTLVADLEYSTDEVF